MTPPPTTSHLYHYTTLVCCIRAQAHLFKPPFNSLHLLQLTPLSLTSFTLFPPHSHSPQLNPLLPPRTHNSQGFPRGVWCLYKGYSPSQVNYKTQTSHSFSLLSHFLSQNSKVLDEGKNIQTEGKHFR